MQIAYVDKIYIFCYLFKEIDFIFALDKEWVCVSIPLCDIDNFFS